MTSGEIDSFIIGFSAIGEDTVDGYLDLVTSEHNQRPNFMATLRGVFQPLADAMDLLFQMVTLYDLDTALGVQLDIIGLWIGRTRKLTVPITGVYFTYNTGPGYDNGIYKAPFDPITGLVSLPDAPFRTYLKAAVADNHWDGSIPGAYEAYAILFAGTTFQVLIYDNQDMSMSLALVGGVPDALTLALFVNGYLSLKPVGVRINEYITPVIDGPVFAYNPGGVSVGEFVIGVSAIGGINSNIGGYNIGHYAKHTPG